MATEFWSSTFLNNELQAWGQAVLIALAVFVGLLLFQRLVLRRLHALTRRTRTGWDDLILEAVSRTRKWIVLLVALYAGSLALTFGESVQAWINAAAAFVFLIQLGIWGNALIEGWLSQQEAKGEEAGERPATLAALGFLVRLLLYAILVVLALDNVPGVEVTALITGLGIGGVAVALAVQNILGDLFASLSIALDKPFVVGDFVRVGELAGTVETIGLKTTRVRSLHGEELIFSNSDLLSSRIRNFKNLQERRVVFTVGVTGDTEPDTLARIPDMLGEIVTAQEPVRFERAHFSELGDFALVFEVVYYVLAADYNLHMGIRQAINLAIIRRFAEEGIAFAFPTQTIHLANAHGPGHEPNIEPG
jgi:small-conductance mechanosensitive channel